MTDDALPVEDAVDQMYILNSISFRGLLMNFITTAKMTRDFFSCSEFYGAYSVMLAWKTSCRNSDTARSWRDLPFVDNDGFQVPRG